MKKIYFSVIIVSVMAFRSYAQGNLVMNGSFEDAGGSLNGWSHLPYSSAQTIVSTSGYGYATNAPDGGHFAFFYYSGNTISQTINTVPGAYYYLSFTAVEFNGTNNVNVNAGSLSAKLNFATPEFPSSSFLALNYPGNFNHAWQSFSYTFQAVTSYTTLSFAYYNQIVEITSGGGAPDLYYGQGGLDSISVTQVPEPSGVALLGGGLVGGLAYYRRRRLKSRSGL